MVKFMLLKFGTNILCKVVSTHCPQILMVKVTNFTTLKQGISRSLSDKSRGRRRVADQCGVFLHYTNMDTAFSIGRGMREGRESQRKPWTKKGEKTAWIGKRASGSSSSYWCRGTLVWLHNNRSGSGETSVNVRSSFSVCYGATERSQYTRYNIFTKTGAYSKASTGCEGEQVSLDLIETSRDTY